jgi:ABC-type transport system involved in cytochrome c biogenesis permease subunit
VNAPLALIGLAAVLQAGFLLRRENRRDPVSHWLLAAAAVFLVITLVERSLDIKFVAITTTYESLLFFSAAISLVLFVLRLARRTRGLSPFVLFGATLVCLVLLVISSSPIASKEIVPSIPLRHSSWLVLHVTFSFIGETFFVVSFVASIAWLIHRNEDRRADMDGLAATAIGVGYPIFSVGALVFGAMWAQSAWGAWWSWDPKQTWALITWLTYTAYLLTRLSKRLRGLASSIIAVVGFAATMFTFFGVNFLLSGLHSRG